MFLSMPAMIAVLGNLFERDVALSVAEEEGECYCIGNLEINLAAVFTAAVI